MRNADGGRACCDVSFARQRIHIRNTGYHDHSTAGGHCKDLLMMLDIGIFNDQFLHNGAPKPILMFQTVDVSDQNPAYMEVQRMMTTIFKHTGADVVAWCRPAPGQSALNPCERRMAPLSRELSGVVIPVDINGTHLNSEG